MAATPTRFYTGQVGNVESTLIVGQNLVRLIKQIVVCNVGGTTSSLNLSLVPQGMTAGVANRLISGLAVPGNQTLVFDLNLVLGPNDFVSGSQTVVGMLTVNIHGVSF